MTWDGRRIELTIKLAAQKKSAAEIGAVIGKTRNAVIGFCRRKKIPLGGKVGAPINYNIIKTYKPLPKKKTEATPYKGKPIHLLKINNECRYLVGVSLCCGNPELYKNTSVCAFHARLCYETKKQ